jgi:hypothetical protein
MHGQDLTVEAVVGSQALALQFFTLFSFLYVWNC